MAIKNSYKEEFKNIFERKINLSNEDEKYKDKSINIFYGICLIILSTITIIFSSVFFFFNMHPYALYYYNVTVGLIPMYILYKYFMWIFLQLFKYS
ncbi:conserved Plasmodium protein, unknown function [Plasmodium chabaudi chabaudi]|uniref:Uncharacterized protein n=1 Tax=Plasmodium chabaudi chabaudi TaxID=31271 RepID=A0A077XBA5_PLACU|nr:conserved Plasmodium protein, unknown function [Plasmodium chabaudi chabaudi]SCM00169.1 conserved Plasmodium protein, unknown function [Plasmodium chabaudi chabaudi]VTZ67415.1 conserved Plasmodium protein, unknown function [Plasmodium chabaudi chabaudi]|eukprot:XP_016655168.1 conserved Plasmodium protein, unknown function [Plasmodium chabaudi chabaudi]